MPLRTGTQETLKLPEVKIGDTKKNPRLEPWLHARFADQAERQNFFQTSIFWQFCKDA